MQSVDKENALQESVQPLGLLELLTALRGEIEAAQKQFSAGKTPALYVDTVEAEVNFVVETGNTGGGGVRVYFVTVEGKHEYKSQNVHKLKLTLKPSKDHAPIGVAHPSKSAERSK